VGDENRFRMGYVPRIEDMASQKRCAESDEAAVMREIASMCDDAIQSMLAICGMVYLMCASVLGEVEISPRDSGESESQGRIST